MLLMAKKRERPKTEQVNVRMSTLLLEKLARIGEPFGTSQSELIRRAVEEFVARHDPKLPSTHR